MRMWIDFWAEWCQPWPIGGGLGFLCEEFGDDLLVAALDVDENPEILRATRSWGCPR